jgi:hypothetical protein
VLLVVWLTGLAGCATAGQSVVRVEPDAPLGAPVAAAVGPSSLQRALAELAGPARVVLAPGIYRLEAVPFVDRSCGNCTDADETVPATYGLLVSGEGMRIEGAHADSVIIETNSGYGILFDGCVECSLRGVTVTNGARDEDGRATSGGVVARDGDVTIEACRIANNIGDSTTVARVVVGIAGVVGRERAMIRLRDCVIERNSWDGVALYRGARAEITDNVIDGVDKASGAAVGGGRGVGIGMTWDAHAVVERNLVRRYWKGIGTFVDASATVRHNVVEDILTWGLAYWGPDGSRPSTIFEENVVFGTGACGASVERTSEDGPPPGGLVRNVIVATGRNERYDSGEPYCPQRPIARTAVPAGFVIDGNLIHDARQPGDWPREPVLERAELLAAARPLLDRLRAQPATSRATFFDVFAARQP